MSYINSALHIYSNGYNSASQSYSTLLDHSIAQISTFIRECINKRVIELHFIQSDLNVADIMTKQLSVQAHERHTYLL